MGREAAPHGNAAPAGCVTYFLHILRVLKTRSRCRTPSHVEQGASLAAREPVRGSPEH